MNFQRWDVKKFTRQRNQRVWGCVSLSMLLLPFFVVGLLSALVVLSALGWTR